MTDLADSLGYLLAAKENNKYGIHMVMPASREVLRFRRAFEKQVLYPARL